MGWPVIQCSRVGVGPRVNNGALQGVPLKSTPINFLSPQPFTKSDTLNFFPLVLLLGLTLRKLRGVNFSGTPCSTMKKHPRNFQACASAGTSRANVTIF